MHADDFFVLHDLSHFALEKTLGYQTAFMGMLNRGMDLKDFEDREKRKLMEVTDEAVYAENMANLFLMEISQGNFDNLNQVFQYAFKPMNKNLPPPVLTEKEIASARNYLKKLITQWKALSVNGTLYLDYNF